MRRGTTQRAMSALVAVGFAAGLGAGLAGCSGDPGPTPTPTVTEEPSPSPTPTPTPTPTPDASVKPERPTAADEVSTAGAEAVAVYFLQLYPYVYATGDLTEWRELSHPECIFCASVITNVEEQIANGHVSDGGLITVQSARSTEISSGFFSVSAVIDQEPGREYDAAGVVVDTSTGEPALMTLVVISDNSSWAVREVQVEPVPAA